MIKRKTRTILITGPAQKYLMLYTAEKKREGKGCVMCEGGRRHAHARGGEVKLSQNIFMFDESTKELNYQRTDS